MREEKIGVKTLLARRLAPYLSESTDEPTAVAGQSSQTEVLTPICKSITRFLASAHCLFLYRFELKCLCFVFSIISHLKGQSSLSSRFINAMHEGSSLNFHHSPFLCFFSPTGTLDWPLQNQLAKSHFTKVAGVLLSAARTLRCLSVGLKVQAVSLGLNYVGLDQTKSHRYLATPVQLAPQGPLIGRVFGPNAMCSELNLPTLGPLQVSVSTVPSSRNCPELGHNRRAIT